MTWTKEKETKSHRNNNTEKDPENHIQDMEKKSKEVILHTMRSQITTRDEHKEFDIVYNC